MSEQDDDFDAWVIEQGGPEAVAELVGEFRRSVADGSVPGFTSADEFRAHLARRARRSA